MPTWAVWILVTPASPFFRKATLLWRRALAPHRYFPSARATGFMIASAKPGSYATRWRGGRAGGGRAGGARGGGAAAPAPAAPAARGGAGGGRAGRPGGAT